MSPAGTFRVKKALRHVKPLSWLIFTPKLQIAPGRKIGQKPEARGGVEEDRPAFGLGSMRGLIWLSPTT